MSTRVCINKVEHYDQGLLDSVIANQLDRLDISAALKPGMNVLIKPNLLQARPPENCATTHPNILLAVIHYVKKCGVTDIVIADSPGGMYNEAIMKKTYSVCGYDILKDEAILNFDVSSGERNGFTLLTPVLKADYIINCPKLKTHGLAVMTAGVKNIFGCIPGLRKPEVHCVKSTADSFSKYLIRLNDEVKPDLTVLDAIDCMEGNGPGGGSPKHLGYVLSSKSQYALDEKAALLMGINPTMSPVIRAARAAGKIKDNIELLGDELIPASPAFQLPDAILKQGTPLSFMHLFRAFFGRKPTYPHVIREKCVGCGRCAESCPRKLITIEGGKAKMERKGCISCYCCQEMCPAKAIEAVTK